MPDAEDTGSQSISFGGLIDDQEQERRDDRVLASELSAFFNAVDRLVTMMRVYPFGHPLTDDLSTQLHARIQPTLDREGRILFNVDAQELTTLAGSVVYSQDLAEKGSYIWYVAYSDGLLQIEIQDTVTLDELIRFLRVIERAARGDIHSDDDTVTLLWEQQFEGISYFAVEGFVDGGVLEDFGDRTENVAVDMIIDAALEPDGEQAVELGAMFDNLSLAHLDLFTKMQIQANSRIVVPELKDGDLAYAFAVDETLVDQLRDEWMAGADLEYRLIEALLAIIRVSPTSDGARRASEMISNVLNQLFDAQMYDQAVRMLELLQDRRELFAGAEIDPLGDLVEQMSAPMQVEALINLFQRGTQRDAMLSLFRLLGRVQVTKQVLALLADSKRQVVALRELVDLLFEMYDEDVEGLFTQPELTSKSIYLRRILSELGHRNFLEWKPTPRLLRKAIDDSDPQVRELALGVPHPCWDDDQLATAYLQPMAGDADERIRKLALGLLSEKHPEIFRTCIRETILERRIGDRTQPELRYLMRLLLENEGPTELYRLLETRGWFGSDIVEYAKMAAIVLLEAQDEKAVEVIEAKSKQLLTAPALKRAYRTSLERLRNGPLTEVSLASDDLEPRSEGAANAAMLARSSVDEQKPAPIAADISDPFADLPSDPIAPDAEPHAREERREDDGDFDFDWDDE